MVGEHCLSHVYARRDRERQPFGQPPQTSPSTSSAWSRRMPLDVLDVYPSNIVTHQGPSEGPRSPDANVRFTQGRSSNTYALLPRGWVPRATWMRPEKDVRLPEPDHIDLPHIMRMLTQHNSTLTAKAQALRGGPVAENSSSRHDAFRGHADNEKLKIKRFDNICGTS